MNHSPVPRPHAGVTRLSNPGSRIVRLCIAFSGQHPHALRDVAGRLRPMADSAGITAWMTERRLTLLCAQRPITPAEWSAVIGWLLRQPEVLFVAREYPVTRRSHVSR
jgi:hypothetical protein